ncbi:hypothetical protein AB0D57_45025 [Streptomyces sp. NPDC048275]|uniref:hypothetical protein n=1 Tax=Streptomyces sp. NPDC048275 TaxID=3155629 RepID=UPI0033EC988C
MTRSSINQPAQAKHPTVEDPRVRARQRARAEADGFVLRTRAGIAFTDVEFAEFSID